MLSLILRLFRFKIIYIANFKEYPHRYDHKRRRFKTLKTLERTKVIDDDVAPPWAVMKIVKIRKNRDLK